MAERDQELIDVSIRLPRELLEEVVLKANPPSGDRASRRLKLAKWILAVRRRRITILPKIRLGEPSWEMVLDLYVASQEGRRIDVTGLCLASGVAPTTALRYVDLLAEDELIGRVDDEHDGRRAFVTMSDRLRSAIEDWLDQADVGLASAEFIAMPLPMSAQADDA